MLKLYLSRYIQACIYIRSNKDYPQDISAVLFQNCFGALFRTNEKEEGFVLFVWKMENKLYFIPDLPYLSSITVS